MYRGLETFGIYHINSANKLGPSHIFVSDFYFFFLGMSVYMYKSA